MGLPIDIDRMDSMKTSSLGCVVAAAWTMLSFHVHAGVLEGEPGFVPLPASHRFSVGDMRLTGSSRITVTDESLLPLADVLADEIRRVTGLQLSCAKAEGDAGGAVQRPSSPPTAPSPNSASPTTPPDPLTTPRSQCRILKRLSP